MTTRQEVINKVSALVNQKWKGDYKAAFDAEDTDKDGRISRDELENILTEAGVGFRITRWAVAKEVMDCLDLNNDGFIQWKEFDSVFQAQKV